MNISNKIKYIFIVMFLFSFNIAITGYINSSFIEAQGWSNSIIAGVYVISSAIALLILPRITQITQKISNRDLMLFFLSLSLISIAGIAFIHVKYLQLFAFLIYLVLNFLILFEIDVYVEHFSKKNIMGRIRGVFYTIINFTWGLSPLIAGVLIDSYGDEIIIYTIAIIFILSALIVFATAFRKDIIEKKKLHPTDHGYSLFTKNKDLKNIFTVSTVLHIIYSSSMIYIPLHLHLVIGIDWVQIGWLILIANIPFLILGYAVGFLSDGYIPEKILIAVGLIITAMGTFGFAFIYGDNFWAWAIVLFVSRIGITIIETSSESYLFKKIKHNDAKTLSLMRSAVPLGYIIAPFIGFVISLFTNNYIGVFIVTAILLLITIYPTITLNNISNHE